MTKYHIPKRNDLFLGILTEKEKAELLNKLPKTAGIKARHKRQKDGTDEAEKS